MFFQVLENTVFYTELLGDYSIYRNEGCDITIDVLCVLQRGPPQQQVF